MKDLNTWYRFVWLIAAIALLQGCTSAGPPVTAPDTAPVADTSATVEAQVAATVAALGDAEVRSASEPAVLEPPANDEQVVPPPAPTSDPNPPIALPFSDNFNSGLNSAWRIVNGNPVISDGKLGSTRAQEVILEIGNTQLRDYTVEFTFSSRDQRSWGGYLTDLSLLLTPVLQVKFTSSSVEWLAFEDNSWDKLVETGFENSPTANIRVAVAGNSYTVFANGQIASELIYGTAREIGAPLVIRIEGDVVLVDDFSIR